jgi:hypothetical protein
MNSLLYLDGEESYTMQLELTTFIEDSTIGGFRGRQGL